jgi:hypothetical protein
MNKRFILTFVIFISVCNAQTPYSLNSFESFSPTGNSAISFLENPFFNEDFIHNLYDSTSIWSAGISFKPSILGFDELNNASCGIANKVSQIYTPVLNLNYFGFELYNEINISLANIFTLDDLLLGIKLNYNRDFVKDYTSENIVNFDVFSSLKITRDLFVGFYLSNINRSYYSNYSRTVYQNAIFSLSYDFSNALTLEPGVALILNQKSCLFLNTKMRLYKDLLFVNFKLNTTPFYSSIGVSLSPYDWYKFATYINYTDNFGFDQAFISEFKW